MKTLKTLLCTVTLAMTFVINPAFLTGCVEELEFEYTQDEMESALASALTSYTLKVDGGEYAVELGDVQAMARVSPSLLMSAHACGPERSFVRGAQACASFPGTQMTFQGKLSITWTPTDGEPVVLADGQETFEGQYSVEGGKLDNGFITGGIDGTSISLRSEDGATFEITSLYAGREHDYNKPEVIPAPPES